MDDRFTARQASQSKRRHQQARTRRFLGRTTLSGFWYLRPHSAVKMHKTRYQVQDFATSRAIATHLSPPGIGLFVAFLDLIPASQVRSQLPAACLRAHVRCLTEGGVPGGFGLVLGRFGRSRNAIRCLPGGRFV